VRRQNVGLGLLISVCALACSSGPAESEKKPSEQCADYVRAYCDKAVSCAASTDRADLGDTCAFSFRVYLPCEEVTFVAADSQPCIDAIDAISCSTVGAGGYPKTPLACQMLFGVAQ